MYLITTHLPIYTDGPRRYVTTEVLRALMLIRDSVGGQLGPLVMLGPSLPSDVPTSQPLTEVSEDAGIQLVPSIDKRVRSRHFWLFQRRRWMADVRAYLSRARVVRSGVSDLYTPYEFSAFLAAERRKIPIVFQHDMDHIIAMGPSLAQMSWLRRVPKQVYLSALDRCIRHAVKAADLSLLTGGSLFQRYAHFASNAKAIHHSAHLESEIVPVKNIENRLATLQSSRPLKFVYCGRLVDRKGIDHSVRMVAEARRHGVKVQFDVIGDGPKLADLLILVDQLGVKDHVHFLGSRQYGTDLLGQLAQYDGLLFTPIAEDTPRMISDAYAAGLPVIAYGIDYVRDRVALDRTGVILTPNDVVAGGAEIQRLDANRHELAELSRVAHRAAHSYAADTMARQHAEWTIEAVRRRESKN